MPKLQEWEDFLKRRGLYPLVFDVLKWEVKNGVLYIPYPAVEKLGYEPTKRYRPDIDKRPKFCKGEPITPYFLPIMDDTSVLLIVEGETDAATACGAEFSVLGVPGATNWKSEWWALAEDYEKVVVILEPDRAAADMLEKMVRDMPDETPLYVTSPALLKTGAHDLNDIHQQNAGDFDATRQSIEILIDLAKPIETVPSDEKLYDAVVKRIGPCTRPANDGDRQTLCIFHDEVEPSFDFGPKGFMCFGCGAKGDLKTLAAILGIVKKIPKDAPELRYVIHKGRICDTKTDRDGNVIYTPLCNFTARITKEITKDNGAEKTLVFEVEGLHENGTLLPKTLVPAEKFSSMSWVLPAWGVSANVEPGNNVKDKLRAAIQCLSHNVEKVTIYSHLGWRKINGKWVFLYTGGAVGMENLQVVPDITTLTLYDMSEVAKATGEKFNAKPSLELLKIGPKRIIIPLLAAVYRAPTACLKYPSVVVWVYGQSGSMKSTTLALMLNHFGPNFKYDRLPMNWISTENAIEKAMWLARDVPLVIDDFCPESTNRGVEELKRKASRVIREVGNRSPRERLKSDTTSMTEYLPNALVISTAEYLPPNGIESENARVVPLEFKRGDINLNELTKAQLNRKELMKAMWGYLEWLSPRMDYLAKEIDERFMELQAALTFQGHARIGSNVIHLLLGWDLFLKYALESGAITEAEKESLWQEGWEVFVEIGTRMAEETKSTDFVELFLSTLEAMLLQGVVYLEHRQDGYSYPTPAFNNNARLIGWYDEEGVYLIPEATWKETISYMRASGIPVIYSKPETFAQELKRRNLIDTDKDKSVKRIRISGKERRYVWKLPPDIFKHNEGGEDDNVTVLQEN